MHLSFSPPSAPCTAPSGWRQCCWWGGDRSMAYSCQIPSVAHDSTCVGVCACAGWLLGIRTCIAYSHPPHRSHCSPPAYTQTTANESACLLCPVGLYKDHVGNTLCSRCPDHANTSLVAQGAGRGAKSVSECLCMAGYTAGAGAGAGGSSSASLEAGSETRCVACAPGVRRRGAGVEGDLRGEVGSRADSRGQDGLA